MNLLFTLVFLQAATAAAAAAPPPPVCAACEAHVFPTNQVEGFTRLGDYGLLSEALAGSSAPPPVDYAGAYSEAFETAIMRFWKPRA
jgi:hypothetical protein